MGKKLKLAIPFLLVIAAFLSYYIGRNPAYSYDDIMQHPAADAIEKWSGYGVMTGSNGEFQPDKGLTRGAMCTAICRVVDPGAEAENTYTDVETGAWYASPMLKCAAAGILDGSGSELLPDSMVNRQEALVMFAVAFGIPEEESQEVLTAYGSEDMEAQITRAEVALLLDAAQNAGYISME